MNTLTKKIYHGTVSSIGRLVSYLPNRIKVDLKPNFRVLQPMDYAPDRIVLDVDSDVELYVRAHSCEKEPETIQWMRSALKEGQVFYDVGANVGAYSLVAAKCLHGRGKVYAFEPGFMNFAQLCKNIMANDCQDSVIPLQIALSDRSAIDTLNYNNLTPGGALHALGRPIDYKKEEFAPVFKQAVLSYRLDDFIKTFGLPVPNHIKIDVDGNEFKILHGAEETLQSPALESLLVELDGASEGPQVIDFLRKTGLQLRSKHQYLGGGENGAYSSGFNYIFQRAHD